MALEDLTPVNRKEIFLAAMAGEGVEIPPAPYTREEQFWLAVIQTGGGGGGGTSNYSALTNKPQIEGKTLQGNQTAAELGLAKASDVPTKVSELQNDAGYLTEHQDISGKADKTETAELSAKVDLYESILRRQDLSMEATGNPVTITDAAAAPVRALSVQIEPTQAEGTPSPTTPLPITGWTAATVTRTGKNLWGGAKMLDDFRNFPYSGVTVGTNSVTYTPNTGNYEKPIIRGNIFKESTQYTFILSYSTTAGALINVRILYTDGTFYRFPKYNAQSTAIGVYTSAAGKTIKNFYTDFHEKSTTLFSDSCGIFEGVVAAEDFVAYQGQSVTVSMGSAGTVYGGTLDVLSGTLTVTHQSVALDTITWKFSSTSGIFYSSDYAIPDLPPAVEYGYTGMCSIAPVFVGRYSRMPDLSCQICELNFGFVPRLLFKFGSIAQSIDEFNSLVEQQTLVYPLATPLTYTLTPAQLSTLAGTNVVYADCGPVSVTYKGDPSLILGVT